MLWPVSIASKVALSATIWCHLFTGGYRQRYRHSVIIIAYEKGLETDDVTSLVCVQIWADRVCYAGDEAPAKKGHKLCSFVW